MVYLICFEKRLEHAHHYIGFTEHDSPEQRLERHRKGNGARILNVLNDRGIGYRITRIWADGDRSLERKLKNRKKSQDLCPVCNARLKNRERLLYEGDGCE